MSGTPGDGVNAAGAAPPPLRSRAVPADEPNPPVRLTRQETQARTRAALLAEAFELFSAEGYHAVSLARIAAAAGVTTGAIYANFTSKSDVFLAVLDLERDQQAAATDAAMLQRLRAMPTLPMIGVMVAAIGDVFEQRMRDHPGWQLAVVEFLSTAQGDPALREQIVERYQVWTEAMTETMRDLAARDGVELAIDPSHLSRLLVAVDAGLSLTQHLVGSDVPVEVLYREVTTGMSAAAGAPMPVVEPQPSTSSR